MYKILASPHIGWQKQLAPLLLCGLKKHGVAATINAGNGIPIILGPNSHRSYEVGEYIQINRYFIGTGKDADKTTVAISWNGFNGLGYFCLDSIDYNRLWEFISPEDIKPWRFGQEFLLFDQVDNGRSTESLDSWKNSITEPYRVRPHITKKPRPMEQDLAIVKAGLTFNSTAAIECLLHGVPVVARDPGSPVYAFVGHTEHDIRKPNREKIFHYLANCQWTFKEVGSGDWYDRMQVRKGSKLNEINPEKI